MENKFKEARIKAGLKTNEAAEKLGVSQPTLSGWERGVKNPTLDNLILMSNLYGVSIDYLLDRVSISPIPNSLMISKDVLHTLNGKPVWISNKGWGLVNSNNSDVLFYDGTKMLFTEILNAYVVQEKFSEPLPPTLTPINIDDLTRHETVWIEPLSDVTEIKEMLRGYYQHKGDFYENEVGNRFLIKNYKINWIAFETQP